MAWVLEPDAPQAGGWVLEPEARPWTGQRVADVLFPRDPAQPTVLDRLGPAVKSAATFARESAEGLGTPSGALSALGAVAPSILRLIPQTRAAGAVLDTPVGRTVTSAFGGATGAAIEGRDPLAEGGETAAMNAVGEVAGGVGGKVIRSLPSVKGRIAEGQARGLVDAIRRVSPELAGTVEQGRGAVAPTLRGGKTSAALQETAFGKGGQEALSGAFERGMTQIDQLAPDATVMGPALLDAYVAMPQLARDRLVGPVAIDGFTPRQAQEILAWTGSKAFSEAPLGQGVGPVPQQMLWQSALDETVSGLRMASPAAANLFVRIRAPYAGGQAYLDMLRSGTPEGSFRSFGNRLMLDENAVRKYVSENRMVLQEKLGPEGWAALMGALGGAQPGTKSLMVPGAGRSTDALMATFGRGTNTGSMAAPSAALRLFVPNIGYQAAGRAPYTLPSSLQAILDVAMQRAAGGQR